MFGDGVGDDNVCCCSYYDPIKKKAKEARRDMNVTDVTKADECCCTCTHNKRTFDKDHHCTCACELDGHYIGYAANFESVCEEWEGGKA